MRNSSPPISATSRRSKRPWPASTALSISAACRSRTIGRPSSMPTSSARATCSRRRAGTASSAWSSPRRTMRWASIRVGTAAVVRPDSRYGVSKAFGEALGALYADKHGLRVLCIRIGNVDDRPVDRRRLAIWLHPEDLIQLVRIGLEHPALTYEVVYGASDNERSWWDNEAAFRLGYRPRWRAEDYRDAALAAERGRPPDPIGDLMQGGPFASAEFSGDGTRW